MQFDSYSLLNVDPLILDLNGDTVRLTEFREKSVLFNIDNDAFIEQTGWVSKYDGIVAVDKNNNGKIDDITETLSEYFAPNLKNGFEALKLFDSNNDGVVDSRDSGFGTLRIWVVDKTAVVANDNFKFIGNLSLKLAA